MLSNNTKIQSSSSNQIQQTGHVQAYGHHEAAPIFYQGLSTISLGHYVRREEIERQLFESLEKQSSPVIEIIGLPGVGKTTLLQHLIQSVQHNHKLSQSYNLLGWINCSSVSEAYQDILEISDRLGYDNLEPQDALKEVAEYVKKHRSILVLDGLSPSNVDLILPQLNKSLGKSQLIYTTTEALAGKLSKKLNLPTKSVSLSPFARDLAKELAMHCLPNEPFKEHDFAQIMQVTGGFPSVIQALCEHYENSVSGIQSFSAFLAQPVAQQGVDAMLEAIVQASLAPLEEKGADLVVARALEIIKQAAWLGEHSIPFEFFRNEPHSDNALNMLCGKHSKQLALLSSDRTQQSLKLNPAFLSILQKKFESEQRQLLEKNIKRLSAVFSYLTNNESEISGLRRKPEEIKPYTDLVYTLLFKTCINPSFEQEIPSLKQVLELGSSLSRLYYQHYGELSTAYNYLHDAQRLFKQALSPDLIEHFKQVPEKFTERTISDKEAELLKLYAEEYLCQKSTLASQLTSRTLLDGKVIQDFKDSYAIQINLGEKGNPEAIAYTLRSWVRALRKQNSFSVEVDETYQKLRQWIDQHQDVFNQRLRAELLVDEGIMLKELEDVRPKGQRDYREAIELLSQTEEIYLNHETENQRQALGMLVVYLGDVHLAAGNFEKGITYTCQTLYYNGARKERKARAYFTLANSFHEQGYNALAKLFIDAVKPLQIGSRLAKTEALSLKIEQEIWKQCQSADPSQIDIRVASYQDQATLTAHCINQLREGSEPSKTLSREQIQEIETLSSNWLQQEYVKAGHEAKETQLAQERAKVDAQKAARVKEKEIQEREAALQRDKDEIWYDNFEKQIDLGAEGSERASIFAEQFKQALQSQIIQELSRANGDPRPMDKTEFNAQLVGVLAGLLPQIEFGTDGIGASIDLANVVQEGIKLGLEKRRRQKDYEANNVKNAFNNSEERKKAQARLEKQIDDMVYYAARCWQPLFSEHNWSDEDIKTLAKVGAERVMESLRTAQVNSLSSEERVVIALRTIGEKTRLSLRKTGSQGRSLTSKWSVRGFFSKPGVKVKAQEGEEPTFYLPSKEAQPRPSVYGYRFGSPVEARTLKHQYQSFKSETEAQKAEEMRAQRSACIVM